MIKFSFKTFIKYCLMFLAFSLMSMLISSCNVKAAAVETFLFLDKEPGGYWSMDPNGDVTGALIVNSTWLNSTNSGNYIYVDFCTAVNLGIYVVNNVSGSVINPVRAYELGESCVAGGTYSGRQVRFILFVNTVARFDDSRGTQILANLRMHNYASYRAPVELLRFGMTEDIPIDDVNFHNQEEQLAVLRDMLNVLKSQSNSDVTGAINSQTQKIQDQINKQQQTNDKLDSVNGNLNDLENKQQQTNDKLDSVNGNLNDLESQQQQTNDKLDDVNKNQEETNKKLDETNKNITSTDTTGANDKANSFFEDFEDSDYGLSDIITMPLTFIQRLTNGSCTPLTIPIPFVDYDMTLPCMGNIYSTYFGDILKVYQTITFGIIAYAICINIFATVRGFKNPDEDRVEVIDL